MSLEPRWSVPKGWSWTSIDDIAEVTGGGTPPANDPRNFADNGGIPWITPADLTGYEETYIGHGRRNLSERGYKSSAAKLLPAGAVLFTSRAPIGYCAIAANPIATNQGFKSLTLFGKISGEFVRYYLKWSKPFLESIASGTTFLELSGSKFGRAPLPLAPLSEQKRIVAKLDALNAKSARARTELARIETLVSRYKQTVLSKAFSGELTQEWRNGRPQASLWSNGIISDFAEVVTGSTPKTAEKDRFFGGDTPFFKPTDLDQGYYVEIPRETLSADGVAVTRLIPAKSVLVTCIGATIGKVGFARVACCTNQQINALVPHGAEAVPEWLYWMVSSPEFQVLILTNSSATTLPIINKGRFQQLPLALPPFEEQHEIVRRIVSSFARADRLAAEARRALDLVGRLDEAILAKAFRGELVSQDECDEPAEHLLARIRAERLAAPKAKRGQRAKA